MPNLGAVRQRMDGVKAGAMLSLISDFPDIESLVVSLRAAGDRALADWTSELLIHPPTGNANFDAVSNRWKLDPRREELLASVEGCGVNRQQFVSWLLETTMLLSMLESPRARFDPAGRQSNAKNAEQIRRSTMNKTKRLIRRGLSSPEIMDRYHAHRLAMEKEKSETTRPRGRFSLRPAAAALVIEAFPELLPPSRIVLLRVLVDMTPRGCDHSYEFDVECGENRYSRPLTLIEELEAMGQSWLEEHAYGILVSRRGVEQLTAKLRAGTDETATQLATAEARSRALIRQLIRGRLSSSSASS